MRFKDTPGLFGKGEGVATYGMAKCEICGVSRVDHLDGDSPIEIDHFAGLQVCDCCFEKIESEVWSRRKEIIAWLRERLEYVEKDARATLDILSGEPLTN